MGLEVRADSAGKGGATGGIMLRRCTGANAFKVAGTADARETVYQDYQQAIESHIISFVIIRVGANINFV